MIIYLCPHISSCEFIRYVKHYSFPLCTNNCTSIARYHDNVIWFNQEKMMRHVMERSFHMPVSYSNVWCKELLLLILIFLFFTFLNFSLKDQGILPLFPQTNGNIFVWRIFSVYFLFLGKTNNCNKNNIQHIYSRKTTPRKNYWLFPFDPYNQLLYIDHGIHAVVITLTWWKK